MNKKLLGVLGFAALAAAATSANAVADGMEKCSITLADGETGLLLRDCASSTHSCAGKADSPADWIIVPKGTCDKIKGGKVVG